MKNKKKHWNYWKKDWWEEKSQRNDPNQPDKFVGWDTAKLVDDGTTYMTYTDAVPEPLTVFHK